MQRTSPLALLFTAALGACTNSRNAPAPTPSTFEAVERGRFAEPWAMTFLPDGRLLVTEKRGALRVHRLGGDAGTVSGVPEVVYAGQGGLGDVILHPGFAENGLIYLSYAEAGEGNTAGAAVARARLELDEAGGGALGDLQVIWRQVPKMGGRGHYGHRLVFSPDGKLFITSGDRQEFDPAQDMASNLGKVLRLEDDGAVPADNPFVEQGGVAAQVWSLGHRNNLGIDFDAQGRLWTSEMGPAGGDEINLVERGQNYGWPLVSDGNHYDGRSIPDHATRPDLRAPAVSWRQTVAPAGFIVYRGDVFPDWRGQGLVCGLASKALIRVELGSEGAKEVARYDMGARIREVEQGPNGAIYLLEDGPNARLLELVPKG